MEFRWNDWNIQHVARHGVDPMEAEFVVENARSPWPLVRQDEKWLVWGPGRGGRLLQAVFVLAASDSVFVIHARPLTTRETRRYRERQRR